MAHIPAPWKVYQFGGTQIGSEETGEAVCSMWGLPDEGNVNAAHIVKCVNAHDKLLQLAHQYRDDLHHPPSPDSKERRLAAIEAVIAKATGGAS